jgi:hypothetical protein
MIIVPETPITEASFQKWKAHRVDASDEDGSYHYYMIPLIEISEDELNDVESVPALFSSESDEFQDENGEVVYTLRLFEEDLPELMSEEEVEILYKIITKKDLLLKH